MPREISLSTFHAPIRRMQTYSVINMHGGTLVTLCAAKRLTYFVDRDLIKSKHDCSFFESVKALLRDSLLGIESDTVSFLLTSLLDIEELSVEIWFILAFHWHH